MFTTWSRSSRVFPAERLSVSDYRRVFFCPEGTEQQGPGQRPGETRTETPYAWRLLSGAPPVPLEDRRGLPRICRRQPGMPDGRSRDKPQTSCQKGRTTMSAYIFQDFY